MMFDIDNFKRYNDKKGHLAGNKILKARKDHPTNYSWTMDSAFRYGGDEFAIILPNTTTSEVEIIAYRIKEK
jgi:diguanylate cyclase (GGDEF)-like protein